MQPCWISTHNNSPASVSRLLGLQVCTARPSSKRYFLSRGTSRDNVLFHVSLTFPNLTLEWYLAFLPASPSRALSPGPVPRDSMRAEAQFSPYHNPNAWCVPHCSDSLRNLLTSLQLLCFLPCSLDFRLPASWLVCSLYRGHFSLG